MKRLSSGLKMVAVRGRDRGGQSGRQAAGQCWLDPQSINRCLFLALKAHLQTSRGLIPLVKTPPEIEGVDTRALKPLMQMHSTFRPLAPSNWTNLGYHTYIYKRATGKQTDNREGAKNNTWMSSLRTIDGASNELTWINKKTFY